MKKILDYLCDAQISFLDLDFFVHGGVASGIWSWSLQVNLSPVYLYILVMFGLISFTDAFLMRCVRLCIEVAFVVTSLTGLS